jgi:hypothetical protein
VAAVAVVVAQTIQVVMFPQPVDPVLVEPSI